VLLYETTGIEIWNITLKDSPAWTLHLAGSSDIFVHDATILSTGPNTDGIDIDCSSNVLVQDCYISTGDDVIAVKSGIDYLGRTFGKPTENVLIQRLTAGTGHGLSVGSEMSAGVRNVTFRDITMNGTANGPRLKSQRGRGGMISDILYQNITMTNMGQGISITLNYHPSLPPTNATATPQMHNVTIAQVGFAPGSSPAGTGASIDGLPESLVTGLSLVDVDISNAKKVFGTCDYAQGTCENVSPSCPPCLA
jgi:polygalacturonase